MKNLNKWLLSAVLAMVLSFSFGQNQNLQIINNTLYVMKVAGLAVDDCPNSIGNKSLAVIINPGQTAIIPPIYTGASYNWEGIIYDEYMAAIPSDGRDYNPLSSWIPSVGCQIWGATIPGIVSVTWLGTNIIELN